jgi:hypothetical protein
MLLALLAVTVLAACERQVVMFDGSDQQPKRTWVLTPDGADRYVFTAAGSTATVAAPTTNQDGNLRAVFWPTGSPAVADSLACATWTSQHGIDVQQGAALRLRSLPGGRFRAVTVTKNILWGASWNFNVHVWDTAANPSFTKVGDFDMSRALRPGGHFLPFPWHVCVRAMGATVELKVWTGAGAEPAWGDAVHTASLQLPPGWTGAGTTGWYLGHLAPGDSARFDDLRTWKYVSGAAADIEAHIPPPGTAPNPPATSVGFGPTGSAKL